VPKVEHSPLSCNHETGPVDGVRFALLERSDQFEIFFRIVFKIGILENRNLSGGLLDGGLHGSTFAAVFLMPQNANCAARLFRLCLSDLQRVVGGTVVDHENLAINASRKRSGQDLV